MNFNPMTPLVLALCIIVCAVCLDKARRTR